MKFVSYAQNYEDVMLWRAFHAVDKGFFIDVGANAPVADSVTYLFYERGWRGINIEPVAQWFAMLAESRVADINLNVAISDTADSLILYDVPDTGLATADPEIAERHRQEGFKLSECSVPAVTLDAVCKQYAPNTIHFLKIDVEGVETAVIRSIDLERYRPQIILVEATLPNSTEVRYAEWEMLITGKRYDFVYFDGLNRFYVAQEVGHLREVFIAPPNVLDDFMPYREVILRDMIAHLQERLAHDVQQAQQETQQQALAYQHLHQQHEQMQQQHIALVREKTSIQQELMGVYAGTAWRITKPLRLLADHGKPLLRKVVKGGSAWISLKPESRLRRTTYQLKGLAVRLLKKLVRKTKYFADTNPLFAHFVKKLIQRFPSIHKRLARMLLRSHHVPDRQTLSPSQIGSAANTLYTKMKSNT
ncbi:FkbM family methyltransferase [Thiothrix winogradskyi]|uniref:FkbM family methyltransferase n=1 Tax=Thiothrix winogradskyi TaxID=96472 RepID=A0ABY3T014_9GAMM|nr:FkbM family methyltransferase [Thiothrix winogradskyi]UJS24350.1 FkbM family methyltransferase [Thiothrix winogradskyi]